MQVTRIVCLLILSGIAAANAQVPASPVPTNAPPATVTPAPSTAPMTSPAVPAAVPLVNPAPQRATTNAAAATTPSRTVTLAPRPISLREAIDSALQHNYDIQIQRYVPELARFTLQGDYGDYDPTLFASGQHDYNQSPGGLIPGTGLFFPASAQEDDQFSSGVSGLLPWGLNYSLTARAQDLLSGPVGTLTNETTTANAAVAELRQPLLKNFWIDPTRATIQIAKNRLKYSEQTLRLQMMTTIEAVEEAYYNLIFARENVKVQETALQLAERLLWENRKKVEVGQLAPLDEKQAESQAAASRADLILSQQALETQQNILKSLITDDYTKLHDVSLVPAENLVAVPVVLNLQDSWAAALSNRPDVQQARLDVDRNQITVRLGKNQLFPQLDVIGQYGYAGRGKEYSDAFSQIHDQNNPYWYYGASVSYPIGNRNARANYKAAKAQKQQSELILNQKIQNVEITVDNAVKVVSSSYARVEATREARLFAEAALEAEQKKLENGKSTSFFVLQFQRDLTSARFAEIQALAQYNIALAQLALQEGNTFQKHHLNIQVK